MDQQVFSDKDLNALENSLRANLNPIKPDQKFIRDLAFDLADQSVQVRHRRIGQGLLLIMGGMVISSLIFLIGRGFLDHLKSE